MRGSTCATGSPTRDAVWDRDVAPAPCSSIAGAGNHAERFWSTWDSPRLVADDVLKEVHARRLQRVPALLQREPDAPVAREGCAECFIRTLKEQLLWVHTFSAVEELRRALLEWAHRYNEHWLLERHNFLSPNQARRELMETQAA